MDLEPVILSPKVHWKMRNERTEGYQPEYPLTEEERQKRMRELEVIRGILIAALTVIITGVVIWALPA